MKLITKAIESKLLKAEQGSEKILAKLFTPWGGATWHITEGRMVDGDMILFGLCDLGHGCAELGYVSLRELAAIRGPWGLKVERDLYFTGNLSEVM